LAKDIVDFAGFIKELLRDKHNTVTELRWVFALPDCYPIVLLNSPEISFDICITYYQSQLKTNLIISKQQMLP
jgi:hypothetical protein